MEKNKGKRHQKEQRQKQRTQLNMDGCTKMRKLTRRKRGKRQRGVNKKVTRSVGNSEVQLDEQEIENRNIIGGGVR